MYDNRAFIISFQGRTTFVSLYVQSTFHHGLTFSSFGPTPDDPRFLYSSAKANNSSKKQTALKINAEAISHIGELSFQPHRSCHPDCYTGFSLDDSRRKFIFLSCTKINAL